MYVCFCFQAEDGIRDLVRSRGLGDVYKRQLRDGRVVARAHRASRARRAARAARRARHLQAHRPVSYTHLTLPTSDLV